MKWIGLGLAAALLTCCAPVGHSDSSLRGTACQALVPLGDGNTSFAARETFDGFQLTIAYLHPRPNDNERNVLLGCRQALDMAAIRASQQRGRFINPIDNRTINVRTEASFTRPGQTVCNMVAPVKYSA